MSAEEQPARPETGKLGMTLLIMSLSMLFAASIVGYLVVRLRATAWPPPGMPRLPSGLWISTLIILVSGGTMQWALSSIRRDRRSVLPRAMAVTTLLGVGFLVSQTLNWWGLIAVNMTARSNLYAFTFFMLTGLHAAHVIGGLIPLGIVTARARAGRYSAAHHPGVEYCTMYWHFLAVVWVVMFVALVIAG